MSTINRHISLHLPPGPLSGQLSRPESARTLILVTLPQPLHSNVVATLAARNHAILAIELLTPHESHFADHQENTALLTQRLLHVLDFLRRDGDCEGLKVGLYAHDHAAPAALRAAAQRDADVGALVVNGGLIDHAGLQYLEALVAPILVLVDKNEENGHAIATQRAFPHIHAVHEMRAIEAHATAAEAAAWFGLWLR